MPRLNRRRPAALILAAPAAFVVAAAPGITPAPALAATASESAPAAAAREAPWDQLFPFDAVAIRGANRNLQSPGLDAAMVAASNRYFLVGAPFAAVPYTYLTRGAQPALEEAGTLATAEVLAAGIGFGAKALFNRPRPYEALPDLRTPDGFENSASFPSGHAAVSLAWATVLANEEPTLAIPAYLLAGTICFSRVYLGVHYPSDVASGALIGLGAGYAAIAAREALRQSGYLPARR